MGTVVYPKNSRGVTATTKLFGGLASHLIKSHNPFGDSGSMAMFENSTLKRDRIGAVMEDEMEPDIIWEHKVKDIEAKHNR